MWLSEINLGNSLAVQWLGLLAFTAEGAGSVPGWGTEIPQAKLCSAAKKKETNLLILIFFQCAIDPEVPLDLMNNQYSC